MRKRAERRGDGAGGKRRACRPALGGETERHLQRNIAGDEHAEERGHRGLADPMREPVDRQQRQARLLEQRRSRRRRRGAPARAAGSCAPRRARLVCADRGQATPHREEAWPRSRGRRQTPSRNGGEAFRPDEDQRERAEREAGGDHRGIDAEHAPAQSRPAQAR